MMKQGLRKIPFVGKACEAAHHIYVDKRGPSRDPPDLRPGHGEVLQEGMSLVVFPEGARTFTGHMGVFRRGAFMLADELQLPVCPLTINGAFDVMPRMRDWRWLTWHRLSLTIHEPIYPTTQGPENVKTTMDEAYKRVMSGLGQGIPGFCGEPRSVRDLWDSDQQEQGETRGG